MVVYSEYIVVAQLEDVKGVSLFQVQGWADHVTAKELVGC
jgi:hypothetical protein